MDTNKFIESINISPLFSEYRDGYGNFTKDSLEGLGFVKDNYSIPEDLYALAKLLKKIILPKEFSNSTKVNPKNLYHAELVKRRDNLQIIAEWRRKLRIPIGGFGNNSQVDNWMAGFTSEYKHTKKGKPNASVKFHRIRYGSNIAESTVAEESISNKDALDLAITEIINLWKLPPRYKNPISKFLLFNEIVSADSGATISVLEEGWDSEKTGFVSFDSDTTKGEISSAVGNSDFAKIKKQLPGENRRMPRKGEETAKMIKIYNEMNSEGYNDKEIYRKIKTKLHAKISISAIRKRIKGK